MKSPTTKLLPTMAISTIKYDKDGLPKRAKYRIVALGNLDPNDWSRSKVYAPVLSLMELCFLTALAVRNKCTLKSADVKQAFVQAHLPAKEKYVLKPPPGCPRTALNTYWLLLRTIYGLRRSPCHWFDKATTLLDKVGLKPCPHAPCVFSGNILPNKPPLYLGLYVDDIVYFSSDPEVEQAFEEKFGNLTTVDFMGEVTFFLGIKFDWQRNGAHVACHMSQHALLRHFLHYTASTRIPTKPQKHHIDRDFQLIEFLNVTCLLNSNPN